MRKGNGTPYFKENLPVGEMVLPFGQNQLQDFLKTPFILWWIEPQKNINSGKWKNPKTHGSRSPDLFTWGIWRLHASTDSAAAPEYWAKDRRQNCPTRACPERSLSCLPGGAARVSALSRAWGSCFWPQLGSSQPKACATRTPGISNGPFNNAILDDDFG